MTTTTRRPGPLWARRGLAAAGLLSAAVLGLGGCGGDGGPVTPSDDPADWEVDTSVTYDVVVGPHRWVVPSAGLPSGLSLEAANNNLDIHFFEGRLFLGWRTAPSHFAAAEARMVVVSSVDGGQTWELEHTISLGADVREPRFLSVGAKLWFHCFEAGTNPLAFEPRKMWRTERLGAGRWSSLVAFGNDKEVPWDMKVRGGVGYLTAYSGLHYGPGMGELDVHFRRSTDGVTWTPVSASGKAVYHGGVSEVAFEFDAAGDLWAVTRNEDGDQTGFGSHVCTARRATGLGVWDCSKKSDQERYDSPEMFRHGDDLYLVARRDIGGPFDQGLSSLPFKDRKSKYLLDYSSRPKRTALYRIDRSARKVVHVTDLPGAGDTAFPSVRRTGAHTFLVANYTSPLDDPDISWLKGQVHPKGTRIYLLTLTFKAKK